ncbi:MAG: response regulator [Candidatus Margulisiibacteriota bacterium]
MQEILIIEDERDIAEAIEYNLTKEGYKVSLAYDGVSGLKKAKLKIPSLILLDLMLPGISGIDICKSLKAGQNTVHIPIIMLTAKGSEVDKVLGLELGADDYITKPFSMRELVARVKTVLKRYTTELGQVSKMIAFKDLKLDPDRHEVTIAKAPVELTAREFGLLNFFLNNRGRVFSREQLLDKVWGIDVAIETRTVDVHVKKLREKLGKFGKHILTLRGVGYKFIE